jgi:hypothetical protein
MSSFVRFFKLTILRITPGPGARTIAIATPAKREGISFGVEPADGIDGCRRSPTRASF